MENNNVRLRLQLRSCCVVQDDDVDDDAGCPFVRCRRLQCGEYRRGKDTQSTEARR